MKMWYLALPMISVDSGSDTPQANHPKTWKAIVLMEAFVQEGGKRREEKAAE